MSGDENVQKPTRLRFVGPGSTAGAGRWKAETFVDEIGERFAGLIPAKIIAEKLRHRINAVLRLLITPHVAGLSAGGGSSAVTSTAAESR